MNFKKSPIILLNFVVCILLAVNLSSQNPNSNDRTIEMVSWDDTDFKLPNPLPAKYQYILLYDAKPLTISNKVYGENVDRAPLFGETCLTDKDPEECSNKMIKQFIKDNIEFPDQAKEKSQDGLEHVIVVINEFGKIERNIQVITKENPCKGCTQAAIDVVQKMNNWIPARKDGLAVKARVIIPIEFETVSYSR